MFLPHDTTSNLCLKPETKQSEWCYEEYNKRFTIDMSTHSLSYLTTQINIDSSLSTLLSFSMNYKNWIKIVIIKSKRKSMQHHLVIFCESVRFLARLFCYCFKRPLCQNDPQNQNFWIPVHNTQQLFPHVLRSFQRPGLYEILEAPSVVEFTVLPCVVHSKQC